MRLFSWLVALVVTGLELVTPKAVWHRFWSRIGDKRRES